VLENLDKILLADFKAFSNLYNASAVDVAREEYGKFIAEDEEKFNNAAPEALEIHFSAWTEAIPEIKDGGSILATRKAFLALDAQAFTHNFNTTVHDRKIIKAEDMLSRIPIVSRQPTPNNYEFGYETGEKYWLD
jgi:hypothetical protein